MKNMIFSWPKILFFTIIVLGTFLRFTLLGEFPVGFHRDEAFLGYNAYSLLKTGRDMSGKFLPIHFESFIFSPGVYSYFSIPSIIIFGLNEFSIRFTSAFFGILTILVIYYLVLVLFVEYRYRKFLALCSAFFLAISPWHITLSRTATENVLVTFFITLGLLLYLKWVKSKNLFLMISSFCMFSTSLFIYQAPRAFLPLFIPFLFLVFLKQQNTKKAISMQVVFFLIIIIFPLLTILFSKDLNLRLRTVSIFSSPETSIIINENVLTDGVMGAPYYITRIFHNKVVAYSQQFFSNYFSHFSYEFLFEDKSFPERYKIPLVGLFPPILLPFFVLGAFYLFAKERKICYLLGGWILITVIGSGLTFDDIPNMQRILIALPAFQMILGYGFSETYRLFEKKIVFRNITVVFLSLILLYQITFYLHQYYFHAPRYKPWIRQDGYKALVTKVNSLLPKYKKAIVTNRESAPTIFFLFYSQYDPKLFQQETKNSRFRDFDRINFGKYEFSTEECTFNSKKGIDKSLKFNNILFVDSALCEKSPITKQIGTIRRKDGSAVFRILRD